MAYSHADINPGEALKCGVSLAGRLERDVNRVGARVSFVTATNYVADVATEADYEYVQEMGSSEEANREILGIMNQVEGVYQSELLLTLRISFQHAWAVESDPYTSTNSVDLLKQFGDYWNIHYGGREDYDVAHLWTGKELDYAGRARQGVVCRRPSFRYSLSTHQPRVLGYIIAAHEIGHNFGAVHPDEERPPVAGCVGHHHGDFRECRHRTDLL